MEGISFKSAEGHSASSDLRQSRQIASEMAAPVPTFSSLLDEASLVRAMGAERAEAIEHLASRVTAIAGRISGPYPFGDLATGTTKAGDSPQPISALAQVQDAIFATRLPLIRMDPALRELAAAIEVLERAFG